MRFQILFRDFEGVAPVEPVRDWLRAKFQILFRDFPTDQLLTREEPEIVVSDSL